MNTLRSAFCILTCVACARCAAVPPPQAGVTVFTVAAVDMCTRNGMLLATHRGVACVSVMERVVQGTASGADGVSWVPLFPLSSTPSGVGLAPSRTISGLADPANESLSIDKLTRDGADGALSAMQQMAAMAAVTGRKSDPEDVRTAAFVGATGIQQPK